MNQQKKTSIQEIIADAIQYHRVDGCFLRDEYITDEAYILVEDLTDRLDQLTSDTVADELNSLAQEGQYFVRHYSIYDQFISLSDIQHALNQKTHRK